MEEKIVFSAEEFEALNLPDIGYWMDKVVPKKGIVLLHGKYGAYKTALGLNIAKGVALGGGLWSLDTTSTRVLFLECDTPIQAIQQRAQALGFSGSSVDFCPMYPGIDIVNPRRDEWNLTRWEFLHSYHISNPYGLVIIDSLRTIHSMSEKEGETAKEVYLSCAKMFPDATILLIHHDRKNYRDPNYSKYKAIEDEDTEKESFMGSQRWIDLATTALKISKVGKRTIRLSQSKSQWGEQADPFLIRAEADGVTMTLASITDSSITTAVGILTKGGKSAFRNRTHMYEAMAEHFDVNVRTVRNYLPDYEKTNGRIPTLRG